MKKMCINGLISCEDKLMLSACPISNEAANEVSVKLVTL